MAALGVYRRVALRRDATAIGGVAQRFRHAGVFSIPCSEIRGALLQNIACTLVLARKWANRIIAQSILGIAKRRRAARLYGAQSEICTARLQRGTATLVLTGHAGYAVMLLRVAVARVLTCLEDIEDRAVVATQFQVTSIASVRAWWCTATRVALLIGGITQCRCQTGFDVFPREPTRRTRLKLGGVKWVALVHSRGAPDLAFARECARIASFVAERLRAQL